MADGRTKPIAEIAVGDQVLATDPDTGEEGARAVTAVWSHEDELVDLELETGVVTTTEDHPFWNASDQAWQPAAALDAGERVLSADGDLVTVAGIDWTTQTGGVAYNLTVADLHTYFVVVGDAEALVHNRCAKSQRELEERKFYQHGDDFNAQDVDEYAALAQDHFNHMDEYLVKVDEYGTIRVYDPQTNTFGSYDPDGNMNTLYKPDRGMDYWNEQPGS